MTNNVLQFPSPMAGGTVSTDHEAAGATEWIRNWFRRSDREHLNKPLYLMQQVQDEGGVVLEGLRSSGGTPKTLEEALSSLRGELSPAGTVFRVFVTGKSKALRPVLQKQLYLIGREALSNAVR